MKKLISITFREQLICLFAGAMFLGMALQSMLMFYSSYTGTRERLLDNVNVTVSAVASSINQSLLVTEKLGLELAVSSSVKAWLDDQEYYDSENPEFNMRKAELTDDMLRIFVYSNVNNLNVIDCAAVYESDKLLGYTDIQSVGISFIKMGAQKLYEETGIRKEDYVYFQPVKDPVRLLFHVRRLKVNISDSNQLVIMLAMDEEDIREKYSDLLIEEGVIVYLSDSDTDQIISSNRKEEMGEFLDDALALGRASGKQEVTLDKQYLMIEKDMPDVRMRLTCLYPKDRLFEQVYEVLRTSIILCLGLIICVLFVAFILGFRSTRFLDELENAMKSVREKNYDIKIRSYKNPEIDRLGKTFNGMTRDIKELIRNKYESQLLLHEMEIRFLQHQMNPHFLFNVLLTIQIKAKRCKDETIYRMISALSALLRASISTDTEAKISVEEELRYVEFYLYLQQMRFGDEITYKILIEDESLKSLIIPKFVIEPIVENAVVHGIESQDGCGYVRIELRQEQGDLLVTVEDNGGGFDVEKYYDEVVENEKELSAKGSHDRERIGLRNVSRRISHIYGEEYGLKLQSRIGSGTTVWIRMPMEEKEESGREV